MVHSQAKHYPWGWPPSLSSWALSPRCTRKWFLNPCWSCWENKELALCTGSYPSCFHSQSASEQTQEKHRMMLFSGSIIHSNCLYLKNPKNCNDLIKLVTLWHASPHSLILSLFFALKSQFGASAARRHGLRREKEKKSEPWQDRCSLGSRWSTNLRPLEFMKQGSGEGAGFIRFEEE